MQTAVQNSIEYPRYSGKFKLDYEVESPIGHDPQSTIYKFLD